MKKNKKGINILLITCVIVFVILIFSNLRKDKDWYRDFYRGEDIKKYCMYITNDENKDFNKYIETIANDEKIYIRELNIDKVNPKNVDVKIDKNKVPYLIVIDNGNIRKEISLSDKKKSKDNLIEYLDVQLNE
ncbi:hypothetical protein ABDJ34_04930 [Finegoldia dalianensis]|uniref:DUF4174 domain-containing protein n=1 Tax=Finegoldia dalianensis TaxID=3145239 RepID=A0ABW9KD22_9FIRM